MNNKFKAVVIGLGRVGSSYPEYEIPRTHAGVYYRHSRIELVAGVDTDEQARLAFLKNWGKHIPVFESVEQMLTEIQPDIISICTRHAELPQVIEAFRLSPPKVFFLEKPLATDIQIMHRIETAINMTPVAVNYQRCWDPSHKRFFERFIVIEDVLSIRVTYANGMFNFASHLLALLITYFGIVSSVDKLKLNTYDSRKSDPSYSFKVEFNSGIEAIFQGFDDIPYDLLELEIITKTGIFSIKSAGCRKRAETPVDNAFYPNYTQLVDIPYSEPDRPIEGLSQAVDNIIDFLDGRESQFRCDFAKSFNIIDVLCRVEQFYKH